MPGTLKGGRKAAQTNKERHGKDFYKYIGGIGGSHSSTGGFAKKTPCNCDVIKGSHTKPQCRGALGGKISRRGKAKLTK